MFDLLFGWGKASKCKKLIRDVQWRLKLLKNKRGCIIKQSRGDVAQLLKHGHYPTAFDKVDQILKDESMAELYDLLDVYCEFVALKLPYIRKHKECPDDINEAVSSLIYSSARLGEVPELLSLVRLLGERYGHEFVLTALQLRPGNLVNPEISQVLYTKDVPDYFKYKLLHEIANSLPLLDQYQPCLEEEHEVMESSLSEISSCGDAADEEEAKLVHVDDVACESMKFSEDPLENSEVLKFLQIYCGDDPLLLWEDDSSASESETSIAPQSPKEIIYLDDFIEEAIVSKDGILSVKEERAYDERSLDEERIPSTSSRKMRRDRWLRRRRRMASASQENIADFESVTYYGHLNEESEREFKNGRKQRAKSMVEEESYKYLSKDIRDNEGTTSDETPASTYSRAISMPPIERGDHESGPAAADNISRSKSFPVEERRPRNQHPHLKLPDYDEIEAKFMELKRVHLQTSACMYMDMIW